MVWYFYIAFIVLVSQILSLAQALRNYRYLLKKYNKSRSWHKQRTVLIIPCKGIDSDFQRNITSFFRQDYENYRLWFVVADKSDPAYVQLCQLKNQLSQSSKANDIQILVAGHINTSNESCSQKIHNLLYCYERIGDDVDPVRNSRLPNTKETGEISNGIDVLAFADSDICVRPDWLSHLVWPVRRAKIGAAAGYRWFIPKKNNLASLALSAVNAKVAQQLGNSPFNQAWGGSMAIRLDVFRKLGIDKIWRNSLSDDLSLSYAVKKAGLKIEFVPACLSASHEETTWRQLFEFGRRQFLITRVSAPWTWWLGFVSSLLSVLGLWGTIGVTIYAATRNFEFTIVPVVVFTSQLICAVLRQRMISKLLREYLPQMKAAIAADILAFWAWSILLLAFIISSAFGRTIRWRGIRYKLLGPTETIVMSN
jgi:ceramide glucosyltransferase